nr:MAG TPA: hypothetical protein [Caudoviricetes sp.]
MNYSKDIVPLFCKKYLSKHNLLPQIHHRFIECWSLIDMVL